MREKESCCFRRARIERRHPGWLLVWAGLLIPLGSGCGPAFPVGDAALLGPALAEVLADGACTCEESQDRNQYNLCPAEEPVVGIDAAGVTWAADGFFGGLLPNPYHPGRDCYRGTADFLGLSSYQCCYEQGELDADSPLAGTFDFVNPFASLATMVWHLYLDVWTWSVCAR